MEGPVNITDPSCFSLDRKRHNCYNESVNAKEAKFMKWIGIGLCLIGIGLIGYDIIVGTHNAAIPKWLPKETRAETEHWEFPED